MTALNAYKELGSFVSDNPPIELATVARPASKDQPHEARYLPLRNDAAGYFRQMTTGAVIASAQPSLVAYDATYKPEKDTIMWAPLARVDAVRAAVERYSNLRNAAIRDRRLR